MGISCTAGLEEYLVHRQVWISFSDYPKVSRSGSRYLFLSDQIGWYARKDVVEVLFMWRRIFHMSFPSYQSLLNPPSAHQEGPRGQPEGLLMP